MFSNNITIFLGLLIIAFILFYIFAFLIKWRDIMNSLLTPLARKIPPYITPNLISVLYMVLVLIAGLFIYLAKYNYYFFLWAALFVLLFGISDSLDGILARVRNQTSRSGAFLDYTLGKLGEIFLFFTLLLGGHVNAVLVVITMLGAVFYSFLSMESQALTGNRFPKTGSPRWIVLPILVSILLFFSKYLGVDTLILWGRPFRSLDLVFLMMPVYYVVFTFYRAVVLYGELKKLDRGEKIKA